MNDWRIQIAQLRAIADELEAVGVIDDPPTDQTSLPIGIVSQETVTPEQITLYAEVTGPLAEETTAKVKYKRSSDTLWKDAAPLWRVNPDYVYAPYNAPLKVVDSFAGTIFDLDPGEVYDLRITFDDGDTNDTRDLIAHTRTMPPARGATTKSVSTESELSAALAVAIPGDVIEMTRSMEITANKPIFRQGTESQPITLCGAKPDITLTWGHASRLFDIQQADWWVFEDFSVQGIGIDAGLGAQCSFMRFWDGAHEQHGITLRRLHIYGVDNVMSATKPVHQVLMYDCVCEGNNPWDAEHAGMQLTWNDDGVRVPGTGNCIFNNDFSGFGDTCALNAGNESIGVFFYRNKIRNSCDDAIEAEYGTRNFAFYDNQVTNCGNCISVDGIYSAPFYAFRNRFVNFMRYQIKCGANLTGCLFYGNTFVTGEITWKVASWYLQNGTGPKYWEYRNNILVHEGTRNDAVLRWDWNGPLEGYNCQHNGWSIIKPLHYYSANGELAKVHAALSPVHDNDISLAGQVAIFDTQVALGEYLVEIHGFPELSLNGDSPAIGAGVVIPNICESGDLGAYGFGQAVPKIGNRTVVDIPVDPPVDECPLAVLAGSLALGQAAPFPEGNYGAIAANWNRSTLAWQAHFHYDSTRKEISLLGAEHGGFLLHAIYDIPTDTWRQIPTGRNIHGHVYGHNADDGEGDIVFFEYNKARMTVYDRSANAWDAPRTSPAPWGDTTLIGGHAFHPNIGADGASVICQDSGIYIWDRATDTWERLIKKPYGDFYGQGMYVPGWDAVIVGGTNLWRIDSDKTVTDLGPPAHELSAGSIGYQNIASLHVHPSDDSTVIILEHDCTVGGTKGRYWSSSDGTNWTLQGSGHPLKGLGQSGWTGCSIPEYGIVWGIGGDDPNAANSSVIWKLDF